MAAGSLAMMAPPEAPAKAPADWSQLARDASTVRDALRSCLQRRPEEAERVVRREPTVYGSYPPRG